VENFWGVLVGVVGLFSVILKLIHGSQRLWQTIKNKK